MVAPVDLGGAELDFLVEGTEWLDEEDAGDRRAVGDREIARRQRPALGAMIQRRLDWRKGSQSW
jgi:hypothetical protein